jgi:hypothetical protein
MSSEEKENVPTHERSMIFGDLINAWKKAQHRESRLNLYLHNLATFKSQPAIADTKLELQHEQTSSVETSELNARTVIALHLGEQESDNETAQLHTTVSNERTYYIKFTCSVSFYGYLKPWTRQL